MNLKCSNVDSSFFNKHFVDWVNCKDDVNFNNEDIGHDEDKDKNIKWIRLFPIYFQQHDVQNQENG